MYEQGTPGVLRLLFPLRQVPEPSIVYSWYRSTVTSSNEGPRFSWIPLSPVCLSRRESWRAALFNASEQTEQLLRRNVKQFRGGIVVKANKILYPSTLRLRVMKKKKEAHGVSPQCRDTSTAGQSPVCSARVGVAHRPLVRALQGYLAYRKTPNPLGPP